MATPARSPASREVFVHIIVDPMNKRISVDPDRFWVSQGANQEVAWHCGSTDPKDPHPDFTVEFDDKTGSPFYEKRFGRDCHCSGLVRRGVGHSHKQNGPFYKYTVTVGNLSLDPDGGVEP